MRLEPVEIKDVLKRLEAAKDEVERECTPKEYETFCGVFENYDLSSLEHYLDEEDALEWMFRLQIYPQGRGRLETSEGFCCLGVLAEQLDFPTDYGAYLTTQVSGGVMQFNWPKYIRGAVVSDNLQKLLAGINDYSTSFTPSSILISHLFF